MNTIKNFTIKQMSPLLLVNDLGRTIAFYTEKLGFEVEFRYEDFYAGIIKDGFSIHLKVDYAEQEKQPKSTDSINMTLLVDHINELYEELSSRGVRFTQTLRQMPYGSEFYIADLDGNMIAFLETGE